MNSFLQQRDGIYCNITSGTFLRTRPCENFSLAALEYFIEARSFRPSEEEDTMAGKILANLIIMGSGILGRAFVQAYRKALENANKTGVAHEAVNNIRRASKAMTEQEARQILGVSEKSSWEEILQRYDNLFERNAKNGSFYLQSKIHRAKECLEATYQKNIQSPSSN